MSLDISDSKHSDCICGPSACQCVTVVDGVLRWLAPPSRGGGVGNDVSKHG